MRDYPCWDERDLVDRLRCVAVEAAGLPWPMLLAIREAIDRVEDGRCSPIAVEPGLRRGT